MLVAANYLYLPLFGIIRRHLPALRCYIDLLFDCGRNDGVEISDSAEIVVEVCGYVTDDCIFGLFGAFGNKSGCRSGSICGVGVCGRRKQDRNGT